MWKNKLSLRTQNTNQTQTPCSKCWKLACLLCLLRIRTTSTIKLKVSNFMCGVWLYSSSKTTSQTFQSKFGQVSCETWLTTSPARGRGFAMPLQPQWWSSGRLRIGCDFERSWAPERAFWTTRRPRAWLRREESAGQMHWRPCSPLAPGRRRVSTASSPTQHLRRRGPRQHKDCFLNSQPLMHLAPASAPNQLLRV